MKPRSLLLVITVTFLIASCHFFPELQKRKYFPGYYLNKSANNDRGSRTMSIEPFTEQLIVIPPHFLENYRDSISHSNEDNSTAFVQPAIHRNDSLPKNSTEIKKSPIEHYSIVRSTTNKTQGDTITTEDPLTRQSRKEKNLAILSIIFTYLFFPIGVIMATIVLLNTKEIIYNHKYQSDYPGKKDIEMAHKIAKGILIATAILVPLSILLIALLLNAWNDTGCYIATMVYKSYDAPEVLVLRKFRDEKLKPYFLGRLFIALYYSASPLFVRVFRNSRLVNNACKWVLDNWVARLRRKQVGEMI